MTKTVTWRTLASVARNVQPATTVLVLLAALTCGVACDGSGAESGPDAAPDARTGQPRFTLVCWYSDKPSVRRCYVDEPDWGFTCPDQDTQGHLCAATGSGGHSRDCFEGCDWIGQ